jgi:hypothetical protein
MSIKHNTKVPDSINRKNRFAIKCYKRRRRKAATRRVAPHSLSFLAIKQKAIRFEPPANVVKAV